MRSPVRAALFTTLSGTPLDRLRDRLGALDCEISLCDDEAGFRALDQAEPVDLVLSLLNPLRLSAGILARPNVNIHCGGHAHRGLGGYAAAIAGNWPSYEVVGHGMVAAFDAGPIHAICAFPRPADFTAFRAVTEANACNLLVYLVAYWILNRTWPASDAQWSGPLHLRREVPALIAQVEGTVGEALRAYYYGADGNGGLIR